MKRKIRLATLFSGIGAMEFALRRLNVDYEIVFACDNGERQIDINQKELQIVRSLKTAIEKKIC